jgi:hypothetical protein
MAIRRKRPFDAFGEVLFGVAPILERAPDNVAHQAFSQRLYPPHRIDEEGSSHCGFDEPRGASTVRYDSFVRDMTT